jgi:sucrose-6-phosphate hydrolase SacC (GH32 family)
MVSRQDGFFNIAVGYETVREWQIVSKFPTSVIYKDIVFECPELTPVIMMMSRLVDGKVGVSCQFTDH